MIFLSAGNGLVSLRAGPQPYVAALSELSISIDVQAVARRPGLARALPQASLFGIKSSLADYVLDDRHSTAATMRPMALIRTKLGLVVPVGSGGGSG